MTLLGVYQDFVSGKLNRDNDERYAGGVWDYAIERYDDMEEVEKQYNFLWGLFEYLEKEKENGK